MKQHTQSQHISFIKGRIGSIIIDNKEIGIIGEINPKVLENWNITVPTSVFELNLEKVFKEI